MEKRLEPKLRFKEFTGEWKENRFKNLVKLQRGSSPRPIVKYVTNDGTGVNWIKIGDTSKDAALITKTSEKITEEGALKSRFVKTGEIILSNSMSYGRPYILGIDGYIHDGWFVMRNYDKNFNKEYLCQILGSEIVQRQYKRLAAGGVVSNISSELVNAVKVALPPLPEQEKIASFLSSVDSKIEKLEKKRELLSQYKKGIMQKIFSQEIRFSDENGKDYPQWVEKKLGEVSKIKTGNKDTQDRIENGKYPFYVRSNTIERINSYSFDGEAILTAGDGVGVGKVFHYLNEKFDYHQRVYNIHNFNDETCGKYIFYYFSKYFYRRVMKLSAKNSVDSVRMEMISKMIIPFPCLEEQEKIANFLSSIDKKIGLVEREVEKNKAFKKGLLQQMFV